ncbi:MAG: hypothetical protein ABI181_02310 [Mycobacteriaceae bacterium]
MRRAPAVGAALAAVLFAVLALGAPAAAAGTITASPTQLAPTTTQFVRIVVDQVAPGVVTATTTEVSVRGRLINIGDRGVHDLEMRLERSAAVNTEAALRSALRTAPETATNTSLFVPVATDLAPGRSVPFRVSATVAGSGSGSFGITQPGVYPVLVNVNGQPDYGGTARLDTAHFLLPVLTRPADAPTVAPPAPGSRTPAPGGPAITVLWPLADRPRLLPVSPGARPVLSDDGLARSLGSGGRLAGLLDAVVSAENGDSSGRLATATCVAVDPDLLVTIGAMTRAGGYQVRAPRPAGDATTVPGTGAEVATAWLAKLRILAKDSCIVALPWAQADLNASSRAGLRDVERVAVTDGAKEVARVVGIDTIPALTWPSSGALTDTTAADLVTLGQTAALLSSDAVPPPTPPPPGSTDPVSPRTVQTKAGLAAVLADPASAEALSVTGAEAPAGADRVLALQNALAATTWPCLRGSLAVGASGDSALIDSALIDTAPGSLVVTPPQRWSVNAREATALLDGVQTLFEANLATPAPLVGAVTAAVRSSTTVELRYPVASTATELAPSVTDAVAATQRQLDGFRADTRPDVQSGVDPATLVAPLQQDLVRSLSSSRAGAPATAVSAVLRAVLAGVVLQDPGGVYTLASEQSPLLLVVRNPLPVTLDVRVDVQGPPGLEVADVGVKQLPASSARQLVLPTTVKRTGQFAVDVTITTASGQQLGATTRLLVRSTAYGTATAAVIGGAGLVLVLLVSRRLVRRFRGQPDRADAGRVDP